MITAIIRESYSARQFYIMRISKYSNNLVLGAQRQEQVFTFCSFHGIL